MSKICKDDLGMWIDHFLMNTHYTAVNAKKIGSLTHLEIAALVSVRTQALEASIRRKNQKIKKLEEEDLKKEAETFKLFM
jgi:hypothetical protein